MTPTESEGPSTSGLRLNLTLRGRSAQIVRDMKEQGLIQSNREAIVMALLALEEKLTNLDLKRARIAAISGANGNDSL